MHSTASGWPASSESAWLRWRAGWARSYCNFRRPVSAMSCCSMGCSRRWDIARRRSFVTSRGSTTRPIACSGRIKRGWWSPTRRSGRRRRSWSWARSPISVYAVDTRRDRSRRGSRRCARLSRRTKRCTCTSSTTLRLRGWHFVCIARSPAPDQDRDRDDRDQEHREGGELCLPQTEEDRRVRSEVAQPKPAEAVEAEIHQSQDTIRELRFESLMERKDERQQTEREDHLVGDLGVHHLAGLTQRVGVHVLHAPGQVGGRAVVLAVDDVADTPYGQADHGGRAPRIDDLPEREMGAR